MRYYTVYGAVRTRGAWQQATRPARYYPEVKMRLYGRGPVREVWGIGGGWWLDEMVETRDGCVTTHRYGAARLEDGGAIGFDYVGPL